MNPKAWHILSYPRSGNHLVRTLVEFSSGRPTLGVIESSKDIPIYLRSENKKLKLIDISNPDPIGYKSHWLNQARLVEKSMSDSLGLIFVQRKMQDAIFSHIYRDLHKKIIVTNHAIRITVQDAVNHYFSGQYYYEAYSNKKIMVSFEELTNRNEYAAVLSCNAFLKKMNPNFEDIDLNTFRKLLKLAKNSQVSLTQKRNLALVDRIHEEISRYI